MFPKLFNGSYSCPGAAIAPSAQYWMSHLKVVTIDSPNACYLPLGGCNLVTVSALVSLEKWANHSVSCVLTTHRVSCVVMACSANVKPVARHIAAMVLRSRIIAVSPSSGNGDRVLNCSGSAWCVLCGVADSAMGRTDRSRCGRVSIRRVRQSLPVWLR